MKSTLQYKPISLQADSNRKLSHCRSVLTEPATCS
jgi:hypothetical protein